MSLSIILVGTACLLQKFQWWDVRVPIHPQFMEAGCFSSVSPQHPIFGNWSCGYSIRTDDIGGDAAVLTTCQRCRNNSAPAVSSNGRGGGAAPLAGGNADVGTSYSGQGYNWGGGSYATEGMVIPPPQGGKSFLIKRFIKDNTVQCVDHDTNRIGNCGRIEKVSHAPPGLQLGDKISCKGVLILPAPGPPLSVGQSKTAP